MLVKGVPNDDNFRLPGEYEPIKSSFMIWPERPDNWREGGKPAQKNFVELVKAMTTYVPITVLVSQDQYSNAHNQLAKFARVVEMSNNDAWIKDFGPFYVVNKKGDVRAIDFNFNAWGGLTDGLYFPWDKDNQVSVKVADLQNMEIYSNELVLEGCSVQVDGEGTLITTEEVVLSENRNPGNTKSKMVQIFKDYFGISKVIWLKDGYFLDETGGDVDNMVSFVEPGKVLLTWTDDVDDPQYDISKRAYQILTDTTDASGRKLEVIKVRMPEPLHLTSKEANGVDKIKGVLPRFEGQRLTATYVNYITLNDVVIIPKFNDPQDDIALKQFEQLYPTRKVIQIEIRELLNGGGGLHTLVSNVPGSESGNK